MNEKLIKFWEKKETQIFIDVCRVLLIPIAIIILIYLIKEVEAVKILAYDVCRICMNKTGCNCYCNTNPFSAMQNLSLT